MRDSAADVFLLAFSRHASVSKWLRRASKQSKAVRSWPEEEVIAPRLVFARRAV
jgi:hypothetical protein